MRLPLLAAAAPALLLLGAPAQAVDGDLLSVILDEPNYSALGVALLAADLGDALSNPALSFQDFLTVLAPTDEAFGAADDTLLKYIDGKDEWIYHLQDVLLAHVFPTSVASVDFTDGQVRTTLSDNSLTFSTSTVMR